MIDAHCHMTFRNFENNRDKIIGDCRNSMDAVIDSAPSIGDSKKSTQLADKYPNFIFSCVGLHPDEIPRLNAHQIDGQIEFIKSNSDKIVAVGEVGLDYLRVKNKSDREKCREVFVQFIELAKELNKPLVIHAREDGGESVKILEDSGAEKVILHCFGSPGNVQNVIANNWFASIPTLIVRSNKHRKLVRELPLGSILTETDSPFLSPVKNEDNIPKNVSFVVEAIAKELGITAAEADKATTENAIRAFNLQLNA